MRSFRVAIFTPYLYPFHVDMVRTLRKVAEVKLYTCGIYGNHPFGDLLKYVEVLKCIDIAGNKVVRPLGIIKLLRYRPHGIIIFGIEGLAGLIVYFMSRLIRAKSLVIVEENNVTLLNNAVLAFIQRLKRAVVRLVYRSSDILVAESSASKKYVLEILRVNRKKPIFVYPHGVNVERFSKSRSISRREAKELVVKELGLPNELVGKMWVSFIGELSYYKGADVLIDAISILEERRILDKSIFLLPKSNILRDKIDLRNVYIQKISRLLRKGVVLLYSPIRDDYMHIFYQASDIIVLPSRFLRYASSDRSPNVALEALASGKLLVASFVGGIPDIVGDAGILVKPNDPHALAERLENVIRNYEVYKHLEEKAWRRATSYLDIRLYAFLLLKSLISA